MATGPAERQQRAEERQRQALYYLNSARRVAQSFEGGKTLGEAFEAERTHLDSHLDARKKRLAVARSIDALSDVHGPILGWHAELDERTTPDCRDANGSNFRASRMPALGYPGGVHLHCRCVARGPFPGGRMLS